ncbi:sigma-54 dependent transcriptional regulator [Curvibacter sp. APW13]|uniref:sigma-54-dependent transcriptional regulator n=1 Tax=Curvibacter sp. APW13 TaxID=3077236 RepID=UPI0028DF922A|nr:sigma-54 dependent transcriptional regulator [Curvibacter sp. APW13]MDT8991074.1 sigma-54 dependent transcriptional regulator [Curvibacter sp. APW13]
MNQALTVYLVEDDAAVQLGCVQALQLADLPVRAFDTAEALLPTVRAGFAGVVVTDMRLPGIDGMQFIERIQTIDPDIPVIMITGHGDVNLAVQAMRAGAYDFIPKPFSSDHLVEVVQRALEKRRLTLEVAQLRRALSLQEGLEGRLVGNSPAIQRVRNLILDVANSPVDVLIRGETGTGKEVVARALHDHSPRNKAPYVALNCGGLPDTLLDSELFGHEPGAFTGAQKRRIGRIEHANGGTLFLDELESMPMGVQIKLLRVLQERSLERLGSNQTIPVDVRVVAATKDDLLARAQAGSFRADLVYRLNVVNIELPALRERREDIPVLLEHFMLMASSRYGRSIPKIAPAQMQQLTQRDWPGNVRELRNVADALVLGVGPQWATPSPQFESMGLTESLSLAQQVEQYERQLIEAALSQHDGNISLTAKSLQTPKTTLVDKLRKHGLGKPAA